MSSIIRLSFRRSSSVKREAMRRPHEHVGRHQDSQYGLRLRSAAPGRMRWEAEALRYRPRKAAAVEKTLQQMAGILPAQVTPLTGRLLVRHDTGLSAREIAAMVHAALQAPRPTHEVGEIFSIETPKVQLRRAVDDRQFGSRWFPVRHQRTDVRGSCSLRRDPETAHCCRVPAGLGASRCADQSN